MFNAATTETTRHVPACAFVLVVVLVLGCCRWPYQTCHNNATTDDEDEDEDDWTANIIGRSIICSAASEGEEVFSGDTRGETAFDQVHHAVEQAQVDLSRAAAP